MKKNLENLFLTEKPGRRAMPPPLPSGAAWSSVIAHQSAESTVNAPLLHLPKSSQTGCCLCFQFPLHICFAGLLCFMGDTRHLWLERPPDRPTY
jgi:hypothetical protein